MDNNIQNLINKDLIIELKCTNSSLVRIGSYIPKQYDHITKYIETIRSTQIKGVWRWWARAFLAGILTDLGNTNEVNIKNLNNKILNKVLGSTEESSKYILKINVVEKREVNLNQEYLNTNLRNYRALHKILKFFFIRSGKDIIFENVSFKLSLLKRDINYDTNKISEINFMVFTLILSLILGGLGYKTSRGFGKFKVEIEKVNENYENNNIPFQKFKETLNGLYQSTNIKDVEKNLKELIVLTYQEGEKFLRNILEIKTDGNRTECYPLIPAISKDFDKYFRLSGLKVYNDYLKCLNDICEAVLKETWKNKCNKINTREVYHTWILGLPRGGQNNTGYSHKKGKRRLSAIQFSIIKLNDNRYALIMLGFLTRDWKENLEYIVYSRRNKEEKTLLEIKEVVLIDECRLTKIDNIDERVTKIFETFWNGIRNYIINKG